MIRTVRCLIAASLAFVLGACTASTSPEGAAAEGAAAQGAGAGAVAAAHDRAAIIEQLAAGFERSGSTADVLFWSTDERRWGFSHMADIVPTRTVHAGPRPLPLPARPTDLSGIEYTLDGTTRTLGEFLAMPESIGLIVVQDGQVLTEHYAPGNTADSVWVSFSVTKSISSLLVGAAIQDGYIESVDEPVIAYLPRLAGTAYADARIADILQMASGVAWNEDYADPRSDVASAGAANDLALIGYLGDLPQEAAPGEVFNYNTGETNLVGALLRAAIGNNASNYLERRIWRPFGMEHDAYWVVSADTDTELGGCCLNATLRDYARLGLFALGDGVLADGTRVLPEGWMRRSTSPSAGYPGYGYLWWLGGDGSYAARGIFGQMIVVDPEARLVIALQSNAPRATGSDYHRHADALMTALRRALGR